MKTIAVDLDDVLSASVPGFVAYSNKRWGTTLTLDDYDEDCAAIAGHPYAARVVGQIAHFGPDDLPWHRVVNRVGNLASGFWGGKEVHRQMLEHEGVPIEDYQVVNFEERRWNPSVNSHL